MSPHRTPVAGAPADPTGALPGPPCRLARVELLRLEDVPLPRPLALAWDPGVIRTVDSFTLVRAYSEDGAVGLGTVGRGRPAREAARALLGHDLQDTARTGRVLDAEGGGYGLDLAFWDLLGRQAGVPLWQLWGGATDRVRGYASTVELGSPAQRAEDAVGFAEEGFRGLKLRLHHATLAEDLALAAAVRSAVGDRLVLMADANQARAAHRDTEVRWDHARARDTARALAELGFAWLEEPLPAEDLAGLARLRDEGGLPISGGERDRGLARLLDVAGSGAYDVLQPDGITGESIGRIRQVAAVAAAHGTRCVPHHGGGGVGAWAHLHLAAALPNAGWFEVIRDRPGEQPWPAQQVPSPAVAVDAAGDVVAPPGPGLGIGWDEDLVARWTTARTVIG